MIFKRNNEVCVEIRDDVIRYVELKSLDPVVVRRYGEKKLPEGLIKDGKIVDGANFKTLVADCIREWKLKRKQILFVAPDDAVAIKVVTVPLEISVEEMSRYLDQAIGESIMFPFDHPIIDYVHLSKSEAGKKVLLVAASGDLIESYVKVFSEFRVEPVAVDISPLCYYRLYLDQLGSGYLSKEVLLIQVNVLNVIVSIFENHAPIYLLSEPLFREKFQMKDDVEMAQRLQGRFKGLIGDLEKVIQHYQTAISQEKTIKEVILVGDNPFLEFLVADMKSQLGLSIKIIPQTVRSLNDKAVLRKYHLAIGLGLKGVKYYVSKY